MPVVPGRTSQSRSIFVAYPWQLYTNRANYKKAYTKLEKALSVKFVFAEERIAAAHVLDKITSMIEETVFGIYDVSGWNPNVTLEYGIARGIGAPSYIAFNPDKTTLSDVPSDIRGYDRLQYTDFDELSDRVASVVTQVLGKPVADDPLEADRMRMLDFVRDNSGKTAREIADGMGERLDYIQLLLRRSGSELTTKGQTRGMKYYRG